MFVLLAAALMYAGCDDSCEGRFACEKSGSQACYVDMCNCMIVEEPQNYWNRFGCQGPSGDRCEALDVVTSVTASKTLAPQGDNDYRAWNLMKGRSGIWSATYTGSPITLDFNVEAEEIYGLAIRNGYIRDQKSYERNSRARNISVYANGQKIGSYILPDMDFYSRMNRVEIKFERPVVGATTVSVVIEGIYGGTRWDDVCIEEILVIGKKGIRR